jgi:hypothetical protein
VFDTWQTRLCRVLSSAECSALGKESLCREPDFTECGSRQSLLCRVPDKRHSAKNPTLGKDSDSGSAYLFTECDLQNNHKSTHYFCKLQAYLISSYLSSIPLYTMGLYMFRQFFIWYLSHPDLRDKVGYVSYMRQVRTTHIITECIEINVTNIIDVLIT